MHGISHFLHHHHGSNEGSQKETKPSPETKNYHHDSKLVHELKHDFLGHKNEEKFGYARQISRGSVSSTYSCGSAASHSSSYGSNASSFGLHHTQNQNIQGGNHSVYHTIHGNGQQHYLQRETLHHYYNQHAHPHHNQHPHHHHHDRSGAVSPTSPSPTVDQEKHHHHHSIQELIRHFGRRLGQIRRQSECQETPKNKEEEFRSRSQSLDGNAKNTVADCETTYRIYESILKQGKTVFAVITKISIVIKLTQLFILPCGNTASLTAYVFFLHLSHFPRVFKHVRYELRKCYLERTYT